MLITRGALRFAILLLVPLSIFFLFGLENIILGIENFFKRQGPLKSHKAVPKFFAALLCTLLTIFPVKGIHQSIQSILNPIFNETWEKTLLKVQEISPEESIINAWWPPGHFIKAIAHRRVTFDGATINFPQAYWMANVF